MKASDTFRPQRRPDVESLELDGELVIWDPATRMVHRLDRVGTVLWPFFDGTATIDELAEDASEAWAVPVEDVLPSIRGLVEQLRAAELLGSEGGASTAGTTPTYLVDPPSP